MAVAYPVFSKFRSIKTCTELAGFAFELDFVEFPFGQFMGSTRLQLTLGLGLDSLSGNWTRSVVLTNLVEAPLNE